MDPFTVSVFAKKNLGFFLTSHKRSEGPCAAQEHELQEGAHKVAIDALREKKIRSSNVHDNWEVIYEIAGAVEIFIDKYCDDAKFDVVSKAPGASLAQAFAIVQSALGQYNSIVHRVLASKNTMHKVDFDANKDELKNIESANKNIESANKNPELVKNSELKKD